MTPATSALGTWLLTAGLLWQAPGGLVRVDGDPVVEVLPKDAIPAIDEPVFVDANQADFMRDDELVIGVVSEGEAKAYSTWLLDGHEIVNDRIGSTPIAVTWCPLCFTGIVYIRSDGARELTFGVSGRLWRENLVMYDRQTSSWWSQASGRAIEGRMRGAELRAFDSDMMTWAQWRDLHPGTLVLSKRMTGRLQGMSGAYAGYHASPDIGVTGTLRRAWDGVDPKARVVSFVVEGRAFAVLLDDLDSNPILESTSNGQNVLVVGSPDGATARMFLPESRGWSYARDEQGRTILRNRETDAEWDGYNGRPLDQASGDKPLEAIAGTISYWFAWKTFYPETRLLRRSDD